MGEFETVGLAAIALYNRVQNILEEKYGDEPPQIPGEPTGIIMESMTTYTIPREDIYDVKVVVNVTERIVECVGDLGIAYYKGTPYDNQHGIHEELSRLYGLLPTDDESFQKFGLNWLITIIDKVKDSLTTTFNVDVDREVVFTLKELPERHPLPSVPRMEAKHAPV